LQFFSAVGCGSAPLG